ncbi:hypothetical protein ID866_9518 [Astraeus odoratus]|nr:hypothetical protein ID866_9518 [Astraeus odoratus]
MTTLGAVQTLSKSL